MENRRRMERSAWDATGALRGDPRTGQIVMWLWRNRVRLDPVTGSRDVGGRRLVRGFESRVSASKLARTLGIAFRGSPCSRRSTVCRLSSRRRGKADHAQLGRTHSKSVAQSQLRGSRR
jgi:hypothetical protein